jgi:LytS/YehU family sensor histidine kinase
LVPPLILQPLVENCNTSWQFAKPIKTGTVSLRVKSLDSSVLIEVEDNGVGRSEEMVNKILTEPESLGVGLSNVQKRLKKCIIQLEY